MAVVDFLTQFFHTINNIIGISRNSGDGVSSSGSDSGAGPVSSLSTQKIWKALAQCSFQKCLLYCLSSTIHDFLNLKRPQWIGMAISSRIINYNLSMCGNPSLVLQGLQNSLLSLLEESLKLEFFLNKTLNWQTLNEFRRKESFAQLSSTFSQPSSNIYKDPFLTDEHQPLINRKTLHTLFNRCLNNNFDSHSAWLQCLVKCMPYFGKSLPPILFSVVKQIRVNLADCAINNYRDQTIDPFPPNYVCELIKYLSVIYQFCLLDVHSLSSSQILNSGGVRNGTTLLTNASDLVTGLFKVLTFNYSSQTLPADSKNRAVNYISIVRQQLFTLIPDILSTLIDLFAHSISGTCDTISSNLSSAIADLIEPVALNHSSTFLFSMAKVWSLKAKLSRNSVDTSSEDVSVFNSPEADNLARFLLSIKALSLEKILVAIIKMLKSSPVIVQSSVEKDQSQIEFPAIEMIHHSISMILNEKILPAKYPKIDRTALLKFLTDILPICQSPASKLYLFRILADYVEKDVLVSGSMNNVDISPLGVPLSTLGSSSSIQGIPATTPTNTFTNPSTATKSDRRELQDVTQQLVDSLLEIVAYQLAQPTWLKRTLIVKETTDIMSTSASFNELIVEATDEKTLSGSWSQLTVDSTNKKESIFSTCALNLMAERLPGLMDSIYNKSDDKDRLQLALSQTWSSVLPFLKSRKRTNAVNFAACSLLLKNMSQYPAMKTVWRRAAMDLLCSDPLFFSQLDPKPMKLCWTVAVDSLITQEKASFKEFLSRTSTAQNAGLFTSKEQEYELRCLSLKRLTFVLLSSDVDQYQQNLPDIQERLADNLKLNQINHVFAQVLVCLRCVLIRFSVHHLTSIWPIIVSELVNVLSQLEQDFCILNENCSSSGTEETTKNQCDQQRLDLYLATCKLLITLRLLPAEKYANFQMFEWIFFPPVEGFSDILLNQQSYIDHCTRICALSSKFLNETTVRDDDNNYNNNNGYRWMELKHLQGLQDLSLLFWQICKGNMHRKSWSIFEENRQNSYSVSNNQLVENSLFVDLLENPI